MNAAPDLALVDAALARARELTARQLRHQRKPASWYRRMLAGKLARCRPADGLSRLQRREMAHWRRSDLAERRERLADTPMQHVWAEGVQGYYDELYARAETRAQAEVRYAGIRAAVAAKLDSVANWARESGELPDVIRFTRMAAKLRNARRTGYWGVHTETNQIVVRFRDRSGLTVLDPSEAREQQAEMVRRLVPELLRMRAAGLRLYYAVASEPNIPHGRLAWGKAHLFERFRRVVLGRAVDGSAPKDGGPFPEIVGALAVQEDPLAADLMTWNVHLNLILAVDPARCTRLDDDLMRQFELPLPGKVGKLPAAPATDPAPRGALSYHKLHFLWGSDQFFVRPLDGKDPEQLGRQLLEVIKYSAKWVSSKQLAKIASTGDAGAAADPGAPGPLALDGARSHRSTRSAAPGLTEWPSARVAEFINANRRCRRVRAWGVLYRLAKDEAPDPDAAGKIRWLGRLFIEPRGAVVQAARLAWVSLTHGVKSGAAPGASGAPGGGGGARAGPFSAQGAGA